jgi:hypothetical protein
VLSETPLPIPLPGTEPHTYIILTTITKLQTSRLGKTLNQEQVVQLPHRSATMPWCLETIAGHLFEYLTHHTKTYVTQRPCQIADDNGSGSHSGSDSQRMLTDTRRKKKSNAYQGFESSHRVAPCVPIGFVAESWSRSWG